MIVGEERDTKSRCDRQRPYRAGDLKSTMLEDKEVEANALARKVFQLRKKSKYKT